MRWVNQIFSVRQIPRRNDLKGKSLFQFMVPESFVFLDLWVLQFVLVWFV